MYTVDDTHKIINAVYVLYFKSQFLPKINQDNHYIFFFIGGGWGVGVELKLSFLIF